MLTQFSCLSTPPPSQLGPHRSLCAFHRSVVMLSRSKGAGRKRTVQRPFVSMEMRSDKDELGITERKRLAEEKRRKEEEEAMLNFRFKHRKIPKSTTDAKYEQLLEEQAIRRKANVDKRKEVRCGRCGTGFPPRRAS